MVGDEEMILAAVSVCEGRVVVETVVSYEVWMVVRDGLL